MNVVRKIEIPGRWMLHSYYTLCPYAPDNSGRLIAAGADLNKRTGKIFVIEVDGSVSGEFGEHDIESSFFHTGFWQTWSPDARYIYYQSGSLSEPYVSRRELSTGHELRIAGDAEGAPPDGEPLVSGLLGMLYASGYGYNVYNPEIAPVPFEARDAHGLFELDITSGRKELRLSVNDIFKKHPDYDRLMEMDRQLSIRNNTPAGLTLMAYCVRWSPDAERFMFYFGNHCVSKLRKEPRIACIYTCKRDFSELQMAVDISDNRGVHWSWHPDCCQLVGYGSPPDNSGTTEGNCVAAVHYNGSGYRKLCSVYGGGHPCVSPVDYRLLATDGASGEVILWDIEKDRAIDVKCFSARNRDDIVGSQRNEFRVCHHPVFNRDGTRILFNVLDGKYSSLYEIEVPAEYTSKKGGVECYEYV